ncbi:MAG: hypothetical protein NTU49_09935, partial [Gammaproteobacteria bacterium]|nr:hypothetical protein [Gammaproteobacteria bacterium]
AGYDYTKEDLSGYSLQPNFKVAKSSSDESNFSRNGHAVYFYGGYMYTYRFLNSSSQTLVGPGGATIAYTPKNIYSTSFPAGFEIGFGKELSQHIDFQMAYLQELQQKKSGTVHGFAFTTETKVNNLLSDVNFVFNPDDMFQVSAKIGVMASQFQNSASVEGSSYFSLSNDTKIDPAIGMDFLLQFSKNMGLRFGTLYTADMDSTNSSGELNGTVMLNYAL